MPPSLSDNQAEYSASTSSPKRGAWKWFLRLALGLLLLAFLIRRGDAAPLQNALRLAPWWVLLAAVAAYWATQLLSAWKWQLLLRAHGADVSLAQCARWYLAGMFWNLWMPTNIGGDGARAYLSAPRCNGLGVAVSSILVERLTGFLALLLLGVAGVLASQNARTLTAPLLGATAVLLAAGVLFVLARAAANRAANRAAGRAARRERVPPLLRKWLSLQSALEFYLSKKQYPMLLVSLVISLLFQAAQIVLNIGLARAVGLELPAATFFWLVPLLGIASLLPVGIGGLGVREAAAVALLGNSAASGTILAWSLLWQATTWLASLPGMAFTGRGDRVKR